MLEIGHEFERNGIQFCVVDILNYGSKNYCLLSEEKENEKIDFHFYEYNHSSNGDASLNPVVDEELNSILFERLEKGNESNE